MKSEGTSVVLSSAKKSTQLSGRRDKITSPVSGSRRTYTSLSLKRNSCGSLTAWPRPFSLFRQRKGSSCLAPCPHPSCWRATPSHSWPRAAHCRLDLGDVDLAHNHHCFERTLCDFSARSHRLSQHTWRNLPRYAPFIFAPSAHTLYPTMVNDGVPIAVGLGLIVSRNLKGERLAVFKRAPTIDAKAWDATNRKFNGKDIACLCSWIVRRCALYCANRAIRKGTGVKTCGFFCSLVKP